MNDQLSLIEEIVLARLQRELREAGLEEAQEAALQAARDHLRSDDFDEEELAILEEGANDEAVDPVALVVGHRMEGALRAGKLAAGLGEDALEPLDVLVLRDGDKQRFGGVLSRLLDHIAKRKKGARGRLLLVAAEQLYKKVKQVIPVERIGGMPSVEFTEDGPKERTTTAGLEVIAGDVSEERLARRATASLEELRGDSVSSDSMQLAWMAGALESIDEVLPPGAPAKQEESEASKSAAPEVPAGIAPDPDDPMVGQLFHLKYRIVRRIGKGGFGAVYEAQDERGAGNRVAIKVLSGQAAESAAQHQSFKDEARRVTRLSHPNVVDWKVFDETEEGIPYFVMELVEGEEFEETLQRDRKIEPQRAAKLLLQVLDALRAAHHLSQKESILHLDLKPQNLFRIPPRQGREEQLKVIDFGIGQYIGDEVVEEEEVIPVEGLAPEDLNGPSTLTFSRPGGAGTTAGGVKRSKGCTPEYASPEQCAHVLYEPEIEALDGRSDLYSLGVVAFEMLTGQLPFKAKSRLDVLRMHREDPAPRIGSMGVRVPRKLARFVDRCLQKDPADRWRDTNEAYRYLHEIVHPPVWKAVAKVTVPIVLVGGALGAWLWATREVAIPTANPATAAGVDLAAQPLYLGPERPGEPLRLRMPEGEFAGVDGGWQVLRSADLSALEGWSARASGEGTLRLEAPAGLEGRHEERVELRLETGALRTEPFNVIWLGEGSWEVSDLRVGDRPVEELSGMSLDPYGNALDLWVRGDARDDLAAVSVRIGDAPPLSLKRGTESGERARYQLDFSDADLGEGAQRLACTVEDPAGRRWSREVELEVVANQPSLRRLQLSGANRTLDLFTITPRTEPALEIELVRPADVSWRVFVDGQNEPQMRGEERGKRQYAFDLTGLQDLGGGEPFRGRIEVQASEERYVLHAPGSARGSVAGALVFSFEDKLPTFLAHWQVDGESRPLLSGAEELHFTNQSAAELLVTRREPVPMTIELDWWPVRQPESARSLKSDRLQNSQVQRVALPVELAEDGEWSLRLRSYRFDAAAQSAALRPDVEEVFRIFLDRTPPSPRVEGLAAGTVITAVAPAADALRVDFGDYPESQTEPAVELHWQLRDVRTDGVPAAGTLDVSAPPRPAPNLALAKVLDEGEGLADGSYRLELSGQDRAGNAVEPVEVEFALSRAGPEIDLLEPSGVGKWRRSAVDGEWTVRARAADPNGVEQVECLLTAGDVRLPIALRAEAGSSADERSLIGRVQLPYGLSEARVRLAFAATDAHGTRADWTSGEIELPTILRSSPDRVTVEREGCEIEAMRLVQGNDGYQYLFGGRGDEVENPAFLDSGLEAFNEHPRRSRSRSWQVPFDSGAIGDFYLDEREVSVAQYLDFLRDEGGYGDGDHWPPEATPEPARREELLQRLEEQDGEQAATGLSWPEAQAYASWAGKRLPTWVEWEFAVRGGAEYRPFDAFRPGESVAVTKAVASAEEEVAARGASWTPDERFADLCGNVAEWTATAHERPDDASGYPHHWALAHPERLMRVDLESQRYWVVGGSRGRARFDFTVADHRRRDHRDETIGFRCALDLHEVQERLGQHDAGGPNFRE